MRKFVNNESNFLLGLILQLAVYFLGFFLGYVLSLLFI